MPFPDIANQMGGMMGYGRGMGMQMPEGMEIPGYHHGGMNYGGGNDEEQEDGDDNDGDGDGEGEHDIHGRGHGQPELQGEMVMEAIGGGEGVRQVNQD